MKPLEIDGYYVYGLFDRKSRISNNEVAPAVIIRGGFRKVEEVASQFPDYEEPGRIGLANVPPSDKFIEIATSACCIRPRAVGKDLVFASTQPLTLELKFALIAIRYEPYRDGLYRKKVEVWKQWKVRVRLMPLREELINFIASEKYLKNMSLFDVEPPDKLVTTLEDGTEIVLTFSGERPQVDLRLSKRPSILWFTRDREEFVKKILEQYVTV